MSKSFNFLMAIGNKFWIPFVIFKTYSWFYDKTGINLPEIEYWNMFAIYLIIYAASQNVGLYIEVLGKQDKKKKIEYAQTIIFFTYSVMLGINFLIKLLW